MPHPKTTVILAQFFIALMMAFLMTGIFTAFPTGFAPGWVGLWLGRFVIAMPIAFVLSLGVGPLAFFLASRLISILTLSRSAG
ncbi:50S ribosomal protein L1 [Phaeobacter gallaeciensis]|uniref:50S ribosomal protein L1 n=1 Tax=Phaeobacter gallaeciensis TaxID=60890 RepID=A0A1B0ZX14_9RHOB|nr:MULTISPECIES: DUF2798 domain-containing protein [Phaeobacter]MDF1770412.1 DUF2798 domain-containing protein [Pseudophaeobacter sp. bin_em_oilr2.035]MEE2633033.1 DUF2798 domain-containing protein [Pseudomonadota bacterium]ANP38634.1 50S ribosomal protein L1 [Phaeobacter gallaeciensis]MDE4062225.1 DUF2798 domain-containing protein [Phaeobacter gallaeciensis]MDE4125158.1 DUF2798 domain-containing protein [Phaeobacter gallaeciensis]